MLNRLVINPNQITEFRSRVPQSGFIKFLFHSTNPVDIILCNVDEKDFNNAEKKYKFENYLSVNSTLTIPKEWKGIVAHVRNRSGKYKLICEYAFQYGKK